MSYPDEIELLEHIKQHVIVSHTPGWTIISQSQTSNKFGDVFVLLEWIEPKDANTPAPRPRSFGAGDDEDNNEDDTAGWGAEE